MASKSPKVQKFENNFSKYPFRASYQTIQADDNTGIASRRKSSHLRPQQIKKIQLRIMKGEHFEETENSLQSTSGSKSLPTRRFSGPLSGASKLLDRDELFIFQFQFNSRS
jgi:hypothetical protein